MAASGFELELGEEGLDWPSDSEFQVGASA
jgi:hypothetical protein